MTQETQDSKVQGTKPTPVLAAVLTFVVAVIVVVGGYAAFDRLSQGVVQTKPKSPTTEVVEQETGPAPTIRAMATAAVPPGMVSHDRGPRFEMAGLQFLSMFFDQRWAGIDQGHGISLARDEAATKPAVANDSGVFDVQAKWDVFGGQFDCKQTLKRIGRNAFTYDATLTSEAGVQTSLLCMEIHLPVADYAGEQVVVDGAVVKIPETFSTQGVFDSPSFKKLQVMTTVGRLVVEGSGPLWIQDNRQYGASVFTIRIPFQPHQGLLKQTELHLKMKVVP